jgi:hypothetical protein
MQIPKPLVEEIARGDAVLLIGAGLSLGAGQLSNPASAREGRPETPKASQYTS